MGDLGQFKVWVYFSSFEFHKNKFCLVELKLRFLLNERVLRVKVNAIVTLYISTLLRILKIVQTKA